MNSKLSKPIAGLLIPSILLPSCTPSTLFIDETIEEINKGENKPISVLPLDFDSEEFQKLLVCYGQLVKDVVEHPEIAERCISDRAALFSEYGIDILDLEYGEELEQILLVLASEEVHEAIMSQDPDEILRVCKEKGLINEQLSLEELEAAASGTVVTKCVLVAGAAVFCLAVAGMAIVAAADTLIYESVAFWDQDSEQAELMQTKNMDIYTACTLKLPPEKTYVVSTRYCEMSVRESLALIKKYYPKLVENIDEEQLVQIIAYNFASKK